MSNSIWKTRGEEPKKYPILALGDDGKYYVFESPKLGTGDLGWKHRCHDYVKQYCYIDDLIVQADKAEQLQKAVDKALDTLDYVSNEKFATEDGDFFEEYEEMHKAIKQDIDEIKQLIKGGTNDKI